MWMLVLVRLALPAVPRSPLSVFLSASAEDHAKAETVLKKLREASGGRPGTQPAGLSAADMTVEDIAEVDPQMAKHLQLKQEVQLRLEQLKLGAPTRTSRSAKPRRRCARPEIT